MIPHDGFFDDSLVYTGPALSDDLVADAEARLGYELPASYVSLLRVCNGGRPVRKCFRTTFRTAWAEDHFRVEGILGVGGAWGIDTDGPQSSASMIREWGYPDVGIVFCDTAAGGHDAVMFDYSSGCEPSVVYIDEDRRVHLVAANFQEFVDALVSCEEFPFEP